MGRVTILDNEAIRDEKLGRDEEIICDVQSPYVSVSTAGPYQGQCRFRSGADVPSELKQYDGNVHDWSIVATAGGDTRSGRIMRVKVKKVIFKTVTVSPSQSSKLVP